MSFWFKWIGILLNGVALANLVIKWYQIGLSSISREIFVFYNNTINAVGDILFLPIRIVGLDIGFLYDEIAFMALFGAAFARNAYIISYDYPRILDRNPNNSRISFTFWMFIVGTMMPIAIIVAVPVLLLQASLILFLLTIYALISGNIKEELIDRLYLVCKTVTTLLITRNDPIVSDEEYAELKLLTGFAVQIFYIILIGCTLIALTVSFD